MKLTLLWVMALGMLLSCKKDAATDKPEPPAPTYALTAKAADINDNIGGYYEALSPEYAGNTRKYPLLVFLHGQGSLGNGTTELSRVLYYGLPKLLSKQTFPLNTNAGDTQYNFIVLIPQFKEMPNADPEQLKDVLDFAKANYRVDESRIYLVGMSMGGGVVWDYAGMKNEFAAEIAAMVPVCGGSFPSRSKAAVIARNAIPIWAFHNKDDQTVAFENSQNYISWINENKPLIAPRFTVRDTGGHDAWTMACDPAYKEEGTNIYEWLLKYKR